MHHIGRSGCGIPGGHRIHVGHGGSELLVVIQVELFRGQ